MGSVSQWEIQCVRGIPWPGETQEAFVVEAKIFGEETARNPEHDPPLATYNNKNNNAHEQKGKIWSLARTTNKLTVVGRASDLRQLPK